MKHTRIITNLTELTRYIYELNHDVEIETIYQEQGNPKDSEIDYIHIQGHDRAEHIYIKNLHEYEHINEFEVEFGIQITREYVYNKIDLRHVIFLLTSINLI